MVAEHASERARDRSASRASRRRSAAARLVVQTEAISARPLRTWSDASDCSVVARWMEAIIPPTLPIALVTEREPRVCSAVARFT